MVEQPERAYERPDYEPEPTRATSPRPFSAEWRALPIVRTIFWAIVIPLWAIGFWGLLTNDIPMEPF